MSVKDVGIAMVHSLAYNFIVLRLKIVSGICPTNRWKCIKK